MGDPSFSGGTAFVAGGSGGIGAAIVRAFAEAGSDVVFSYYRNERAAEALAEELAGAAGSVGYCQLDLQDHEGTAARLEQVKNGAERIHSVVYAAGPNIAINFVADLCFEEWHKTFEADTHGCFSLVHAALPILRDQGGGSLCAVTTTQASKHLAMSALSSSPKAAIEDFFAVVAKENGRFAIRANCVRSGWLDGGKLDDGIDGQVEDKAMQAILRDVPLGRFGHPDDVAGAVLFLASKQGRYISGVNLAVDGGWCL